MCLHSPGVPSLNRFLIQGSDSTNCTPKDPPTKSTCHLERRSPRRPKSKDLRLLFGDDANPKWHLAWIPGQPVRTLNDGNRRSQNPMSAAAIWHQPKQKAANSAPLTIHDLAVAADSYFWVGTPKQCENPSSSVRKNSVWPYSRSSSSETL